MISFHDVEFSYGREPLLRGLSFEVRAGTVALLGGPNGAGKSTAMKLGYRLLAPKAGRVEVFGRQWSDLSEGRLKREIGFLPQGDSLFDTLTVRENLLTAAKLYGCSQPDRALAEVVERFAIGASLDKPFRLLSGGQRRAACICAAVLHRPRLVFFDEPFEGLDQGRRETVAAHLVQMAEGGATVLVTSHATEPLAGVALQRIELGGTGEPGAY